MYLYRKFFGKNEESCCLVEIRKKEIVMKLNLDEISWGVIRKIASVRRLLFADWWLDHP